MVSLFQWLTNTKTHIFTITCRNDFENKNNAKPLMKELGVPATSRASMYLYNDESDVDALVDSLESAGEMFAL